MREIFLKMQKWINATISDTSDSKTEESLERKFPRYQVPNIILYIKGAKYWCVFSHKFKWLWFPF